MIIFDQARCTYCHLCTLYCSLAFGTGGAVEYRPAIARIRVAASEDDTLYAAHVCFQCQAAWCASACPVPGCISRNPQSGVVEIDEASCTGCGQCVRACVYGCIFLAERKAVKCEVCQDPLCVKACAAQALTLAEADDDYAERIGQLYEEVPL